MTRPDYPSINLKIPLLVRIVGITGPQLQVVTVPITSIGNIHTKWGISILKKYLYLRVLTSNAIGPPKGIFRVATGEYMDG
jgi:hypothetical protein